MHKSKATFCLMALLVAGAAPIGCTDVGDNTSLGDDASSGVDVTVPEDVAQPSPDAPEEAATGNGTDATLDSASEDGTAAPEDTGVTDTGSPVPDGNANDSAPPEAAAPDAGMDASIPEASIPETGAPEAGPDGGSTPDAGHEAGPSGPTPCTAAPCAASGANSVKCPDSPTSDGVCTATEAVIVAQDIANGHLDGTGQLPAYVSQTDNGSCYSCLNVKSCLDDDQMDTGNECSDAPSTAGGPAACLTTLHCVFNTNCQGAGGIAGTSATASQENVNLCYCGGNLAGSACSASGITPAGLCDSQEAAGLGFAVSDNTDILLNFGSKTLPSGIANHLFQCASSNKCTLCK